MLGDTLPLFSTINTKTGYDDMMMTNGTLLTKYAASWHTMHERWLRQLAMCCHCIQLSISDSVKAAEASALSAKCRHLVGHFKHSSANSAEWKASHSRVQENSSARFHKLQQDVSTWWNSTYLMIVRLLELQRCCQTVSC